ncbi:MAG: hypothetical protein R6V04_00265, partial [bacterium]
FMFLNKFIQRGKSVAKIDIDCDTDSDTDAVGQFRAKIYPFQLSSPNVLVGDPLCNLFPWIPAFAGITRLLNL